jgi:hypothetical protein
MAEVTFQAAPNTFIANAQVVVITQGFTNIALLGLVTSDQIKQLCKLIRENDGNPVPINIVQQQMSF